MDLLKLKYFHTVAVLGNMTRAAETLHISQPSLSIMIRKLEEEIGVQLFDRVGRGIVLNAYGAILLEHTNRMLNEIEKAGFEIDILKKGQERAINICGNVESQSSSLLRAFFEKTSTHRIRQRICTYGTAEKLLLKEDYQVAITFPALDHDQLRTIPLLTGQLVCYLSKEHPLAQNKKVCLDDIENEKFVALFREEASTIDTRTYFREHYGFEPYVLYEGNKEMVYELIERNQGIMLGLPLDQTFLKNDQIRMVTLSDSSAHFKVGLSWKKNNQRHAACQYFVQFARRYFQGLQDILNREEI